MNTMFAISPSHMVSILGNMINSWMLYWSQRNTTDSLQYISWLEHFEKYDQ